MVQNIKIGVDIGSSHIRTLVLEKRNNGEPPRVLGFGLEQTKGIRKGEIIEELELNQAIKDCFKKANDSSGIKIKEIYAGISGECLKTYRSGGITAISRADGEITDFDVSRAVEMAKNNLGQILNREILHAVPIGFLVDDNLKIQNPIGLKGTRLEADVFFISILAKHLKNLAKSFENAGVSVAKFVVDPLASAKALLSKEQREVGVLLLDIGGTSLSAAIFEEDIPVSIEIFSIGSNHITNDIAVGFQISLTDAEELKLNYQNQTLNREQRKKIDEIISARLKDIFELVEKYLRRQGKNNLLPAGVVLSGGGSNLFDLAKEARKNLKLPAEIGILNSKIKAPADFIYLPQWAVSAGLCLMALNDSEEEKSWAAPGFKKTKNFILRWFRSFIP